MSSARSSLGRMSSDGDHSHESHSPRGLPSSSFASQRFRAGSRRTLSRRTSLRASAAAGDYKQHELVTAEDIDELFKRSNALNKSDVSVFLGKRFQVREAVVTHLFEKHHSNQIESMDREEFSHLVKDLNQSLSAFDEEEVLFYQRNERAIYCAMCFVYCCCLPTLGGSCYSGSQVINKHVVEMEQHQKTQTTRLTALLLGRQNTIQAVSTSSPTVSSPQLNLTDGKESESVVARQPLPV